MKRITLLMVALLMIGGMAMAQGHRRGGDRKMDPKAHAERMTERMSKEYSLNDTQKKQLLEANQALAEKMGSRPAGTKSGMKQGKKEKCTQVTDSCCSNKEGRKAPKRTKEDREKMHKEMKASREAYDGQLKKIMTKEQYDTYTTKQAERQQKMKEGRKGK